MKNKSWPVSVVGSKSSPPVVFLHGFLGDSLDWEFLRADLTADFLCIFPDLPGHGQNQLALPDRRLSFDWFASGLAHTLDGLGIETAHLVGYSMGGRLGLYFAVKYPGQLRSLCLESASPGLSGRVERRERCELDAQRAAEIERVGFEQFIADWYRMPLFASLQSDPALLEKLLSRRVKNDPQAMRRVIAELSPGCQPSLWKRLAAIQVPALLLAGELDGKYRLLVEEMASRMPDARIALAPDAGHNIHLERPDWYRQKIRDFLKSQVA